MKKLLSLAVFLMLISSSNSCFAKSNYRPDEILVKFKPGVSETTVYKFNKKFKIKKVHKTKHFRKILIPSNQKFDKILKEYQTSGLVEYAEPNYLAEAQSVPNDPLYYYQWGLAAIDVEKAWDITKGKDAIVAVLDTGVAYENYGDYVQASDLSGTKFVSGYDYVNEDAHPNDDNGHGTHVTGTIAGTTNNSLGVASVSCEASIMPVKVLDATGYGSYSDMAQGIYFAVNNGAKVINMSLGGTSPSYTLENAVKYAYEQGVTVVCAAGNNYERGNEALYPASYNQYCISVGAIQYDKTRAYYSNTGSYIEFVAPGGNLNLDQNTDSQKDGILQQTFKTYPTAMGYYYYQGTSMATPHVSGVVALLVSVGHSNPDDIENILKKTSEDLGVAGRDDQYGYGLIDAYKAIMEASPVPSPEPTPEPVPVEEFGIGVRSLEMNVVLKKRGRWTSGQAYVEVTVIDADWHVIPDVKITGTWGGKVSGESTAVTDSLGVASLSSPTVNKLKSGDLFVFEITNLEKNGTYYNTNLNVESTKVSIVP